VTHPESRARPAGDRLVASFRAVPWGAGRSFLERARALAARAAAHGGVLVAWDGSRVAFAFDAERLPAVIELATVGGEDRVGAEPPFSVGLAQGELERLTDDGSGAHLSWGAALVAASALAAVAEPGELLCAETVRAVAEGELLTTGSRVGRDGPLRLRGARLDAVHPWRAQAAAQLAHLRVAPFVGAPLAAGTVEPGALLVLRADPGTGGSRHLAELAGRASRALSVVPSGSGFEPLGALRRALARSTTRELSPLLLELAGPLEALLAGDGVTLETAARLVTAFLWPRTDGQAPGLLLLDDVKQIDPATLEACVLAAARSSAAPFGVVARLDATSGLPSVLAALAPREEVELAPLSPEAAFALAGGCTSDALDETACRRWARLASYLPLGVVEALSYGIATGELRWEGTRARLRSRSSGRGKVRGAADWILLRARGERPRSRLVLGLIALLGGEAKFGRLVGVLSLAGHAFDVEGELEALARGRWLLDTQEDWVALPSRTHREALLGLLDGEAREALHRAAAELIQVEEGAFGRVESAWHAAQVGDGPAAAAGLLAAARATSAARLEASTTQLIAFARRADPSCEEAALELLSNALERAPSMPPRAHAGGGRLSVPPPPRSPGVHVSIPPPQSRSGSTFVSTDLALPPVVYASPMDAIEPTPPPSSVGGDSEPPTLVTEAVAAPGDRAAGSESGSVAPAPLSGVDIAKRLGHLAKEALLSADNAALERWVDGLRAAGGSPTFTERLGALSRLGRGDIGDALRVLRRLRSGLDPKDHRLRCQTSLALGLALSVAGRQQEALLEGMDALARARHIDDDRGAQACLVFLAKLYSAAGRDGADRILVKAWA
jgi:hypothetical protein